MKIDVNGVTLHYEKTGAGAPVLLLHGNGEDHRIFDKLSKRLQNHFTVYAVDSRNHGCSSKSDVYSYEAMAEDVYAFIQALELECVNLIGFSDGAIIGLILAMKHPETLHKIALLGVNLKPEDFTLDSLQFIKQTFEETKDPLFQLMLEQPDIELEEVKRVTMPALIVAADDDIFKSETFPALAQAMPDARLLVMKGHTHDSYITNQDILYSDLMQFFE